METGENENVGDTGCTPTPTPPTEGNDKGRTRTANTTNESVSMHVGSTATIEVEPPTKRLKSEVWKDFEIVYVEGVPRKGTKDIKQHILVQEPMVKGGNAFSLSNYTFNAATTRNDLAEMIVMHDYPLSVVEHYGLRKFSSGLNPMFKMPCRSTIKNDIMKLYETKKGSTLRCLEENESRIALTSDMWTGGPQKKGYVALTAHYIDANWKLQNKIISFIHVPSPHTADALSHVMMECFLDWNIDNKLSSLTLDNCSTNDALVDKLLGNGQSSTTHSDGGISSKGKEKASWLLQFANDVSVDDMFETTELDHYLDAKLLPIDDDEFDILMWWKCNGAKYPIMMKIARDLLAIPISTVASESAFSMSGNKITKQRSRLKAQIVATLMCTQSWLRKEIEDKKDGEPEGFDQTVAYDEDVE